MKSLLAALLAAIPGMVIGMILWTALAVFVLAVYWFGYQLVYLGALCNHGK